MFRFFATIYLLSSASLAVQFESDDYDDAAPPVNSRLLGSIAEKVLGTADSAIKGAGSFVEAAKDKVSEVADNIKDTAVNAANTVGERVIDPIVHEITEPRVDILPGTSWCGNGNRSRSLEDVGLFENTDSCCREHDLCPDNIKRGSSKYGLENTSSFTRSHCDCDTKFYTCLRDAGNPVATKVGVLYFNVLRQKCFKLEHPVKTCKRQSGIILRVCDEYELNYEEPKSYQFFDNPAFPVL